MITSVASLLDKTFSIVYLFGSLSWKKKGKKSAQSYTHYAIKEVGCHKAWIGFTVQTAR